MFTMYVNNVRIDIVVWFRGGACKCVRQPAWISLFKDHIMRGKSNIYI